MIFPMSKSLRLGRTEELARNGRRPNSKTPWSGKAAATVAVGNDDFAGEQRTIADEKREPQGPLCLELGKILDKYRPRHRQCFSSFQ